MWSPPPRVTHQKEGAGNSSPPAKEFRRYLQWFQKYGPFSVSARNRSLQTHTCKTFQKLNISEFFYKCGTFLKYEKNLVLIKKQQRKSFSPLGGRVWSPPPRVTHQKEGAGNSSPPAKEFRKNLHRFQSYGPFSVSARNRSLQTHTCKTFQKLKISEIFYKCGTFLKYEKNLVLIKKQRRKSFSPLGGRVWSPPPRVTHQKEGAGNSSPPAKEF